MIRKIVKIDEEKCDGCGQCVPACAEGAIEVIDGKARLVSEIYCDGLGACLGECPQDAITIEERETEPFDEAAAKEFVESLEKEKSRLGRDCPGTMARELGSEPVTADADGEPAQSELRNWPVQLKLVPPDAPYFKGANLLFVADCVPFAMADFHSKFLRGCPVVVGCAKLDDSSFYIEKLVELLKHSELNSLTVVHMEVPCCSGLTRIAEIAETVAADAGSAVPLRDVTVSLRGEMLGIRDLNPGQADPAACKGGV